MDVLMVAVMCKAPRSYMTALQAYRTSSKYAET